MERKKLIVTFKDSNIEIKTEDGDINIGIPYRFDIETGEQNLKQLLGKLGFDVVREQKKAIDVSIEVEERYPLGAHTLTFIVRATLSNELRATIEHECCKRHGVSAKQELERCIRETVERFVTAHEQDEVEEGDKK